MRGGHALEMRRFTTYLAGLALLALTSQLKAAPGKLAPSPGTEPMAEGKFQPSWESLSQYETPEWFRDAKFGIWAHWSAQCQPEQGDWYARSMYIEGSADYLFHVKTYGHPSVFGFKDVCNIWKADKFDPEKLIALYKRAGAKYFVALANHHCNFDCFDSKHQPWNSVNVGPKRDLVGAWEKAARAAGLRFGVTEHAGRSWSWYEVSQGADVKGDRAGVPYDGHLTKADGKGQWWDGLDPQDLYAQNHKPAVLGPDHKKTISPGEAPSQAYCDKFYNRTLDLINKYQPDLLYFDDGVLPLRGSGEAFGLQIAAHLYNSSMKQHGGKNEAVMNTKGLNEEQRKCLVWDIERGVADHAETFAWQTDTCIGSWHYQRSIFEKHHYKTPQQVIHMLIDIVSKNGNLLLNIPVRGNGEIDEDEVACLEGIAKWMAVNSSAIYATRPWKVYGEGPATREAQEKGRFGGQSDTRKKPFTAEDIRFTASKDGKTINAIMLGVPSGEIRIASLGTDAKLVDKAIVGVKLLGSDEKLDWKQEAGALVIKPPTKFASEHAVVLQVRLGNDAPHTISR